MKKWVALLAFTVWSCANLWLRILLDQPLRFRLVACDVGQGDAFLLSIGQTHVLYDLGPKTGLSSCLRSSMSLLDPFIDAVVISHGDSDHVGGMETLRSSWLVGQWYAQGLTSEQWQEWSPHAPAWGDQLLLPGWRGRFVWWPITDISTKNNEFADRNNDSLGLWWGSNSFGWLGLGDRECEAELAVTSSHLLNQTTVLKISHHGSKFSSCPILLGRIRPETAIISVGSDNKYGHPDPEVIKNIDKQAIKLYRTDQNGAVILQL